ncbi:MAG: Rieske 2Fe-2S domain-containing protein [Actinobacteria bacterium]|jgi:3-phenylpropionate/trans-cinnamate dioxygenase ferredoxin subunit|uniref:Unannotated protein n=1 Tax=freshwater metagenome TaxID=449393 RepID=A0A6J6T631_9ZZZZ|nr:Rieske 2Fe-2S domain-containing protein [Actinomycetota bacterium]MSY94657.1 Rieske 2Fe-2S domain-containing protein [Actinomycetota bacterium]
MTEFVVACRLADVQLNGAVHVELNGTPIAVAHTVEGVFAIRDVCSHADVRLSEGEVDGCAIECWLHGSQFDLRTGSAMTLPAIAAVPVYEVRLSGEGDDTVVEVATTPIDVTSTTQAQ